ncbi:hypothetical protein HS041_26075 [Planomonospora sp. ID67723]|uniref:hypothetical protein n=1 Tax=Planomonospora sp. ID67723 TaxID=2738134 RepID=UPI0018C42299|nr:hypothetical protein [Planomonospora sp. ID67723]MBG0831225.1 hypothetical protein [Planomonospora sp. ID67723]
MHDVDELVSTVFSRLSPLVVEDVIDEGERIRVRARIPDGPVACPDCEAPTTRMHGCHQRSLTDVPIDARHVLNALVAWICP